MNINKALKYKKKLIKQIEEAFKKVQQYNSIEEGSEVPYDSKKEFSKCNNLVEELITLKTKIHLANAPIYNKIFRMGELKSMVNKIKSIPTNAGKVRSYGSSEPTVIIANINIIEKDQLIFNLEEEIENLQSELEEFNAITKL